MRRGLHALGIIENGPVHCVIKFTGVPCPGALHHDRVFVIELGTRDAVRVTGVPA
jgi:hypothetical protein